MWFLLWYQNYLRNINIFSIKVAANIMTFFTSLLSTISQQLCYNCKIIQNKTGMKTTPNVSLLNTILIGCSPAGLA
jgi:hypothetical protein